MARIVGNVGYDEEYIVNSRGMRLFTCKWFPVDEEPKALIFMCHGYAMECSITMNGTATKLAKEGFAAYGIDYEGHGKSDGVVAHIDSFDLLVQDCSNHFSTITEREENRGKIRLLMGESMGGAVALLLHRLTPDFWDGAILLAPMCKIADDVKPPKLAILALQAVMKLRPTWKNIFTNDLVDVAFRLPQTRQEVRENPYCYKGRVRLKTGFELLRVCDELERQLHKVSLPFIVIHGEEDKVTDKGASKQLYEIASSSDKTLKLYPDMWHSLLYGEKPENVEIVFSDIIQWINKRLARHNEMLTTKLMNKI